MIPQTIYRMPDSVPPGNHSAAVRSIQFETTVSKAGNPYNRLKIEFGVLYEDYRMIVPMYFNLPIFWREEATLVKVARAFDIFPGIGEPFHVESLIGRIVLVTIEEHTYKDKVYNNIVDMVPLIGKAPHPLQDLLDLQQKTKQQTDTLFDDENEALTTTSYTDSNKNDDSESDEDEEPSFERWNNTENDEADDGEQNPPPPKPPHKKPCLRRTPISGGANPLKKPMEKQNNQDLGIL